ncbi:PHP domain-containing protein [Anaerobium acetethylicum]|uniref:Polymerase/histidinol phosphatase N-terminal domain-containing protein n=1 Tax=Anaerobium acetethylicum TaxID=1619234 RepID=A0A1D3TW35_9FIRM|nr:PHP domain-containing protein [Anaerobium acetethylicum]SCP98410.1 fructose-bisphosphate aldolase, class II/hypothetical protein [Anaerobium acetethylicum]
MSNSNNIPNYKCDLHGHTTRSDGSDSPKEFIDNAVYSKMKIVGITDHDVLPPETITVNGNEMDIIEYASKNELILLKGIEISCETDVEDVHIVCYGCNWKDPFFGKLEQDVVKSKIESYKKLVDRLNENGIHISWEEVLDNNGTPVKEEQIQKKMIFELMAKRGFVNEWKDAKLLVKNHAEYDIKREKPDPAMVIKEVHRCGGIAILAHPYLICENPIIAGKNITRDEYIDYLIENGIDGIEACYTYDKTSYSGTKSKSEIYAEVIKKYSDRVSILSGGSDYHADHKKGVKDARYIGECGVSESYFFSNDLLNNLITFFH